MFICLTRCILCVICSACCQNLLHMLIIKQIMTILPSAGYGQAHGPLNAAGDAKRPVNSFPALLTAHRHTISVADGKHDPAPVRSETRKRYGIDGAHHPGALPSGLWPSLLHFPHDCCSILFCFPSFHRHSIKRLFTCLILLYKFSLICQLS